MGRGPSMSDTPSVNVRFVCDKKLYWEYKKLLYDLNQTGEYFWHQLLKKEISLSQQKPKLTSIKGKSNG